ncbi:MAG: MerR family transcriptional regulator [Rhodocyclales bacterium]|nr:MerR family transcriptional regulator [Rhodocyclales bacterium]
MSTNIPSSLQGLIVEEEIRLSLSELCQACRAREELITAWVMEGVLEPEGARPQEWRFAGHSLRRARLALRLAHGLEINPAGVGWRWTSWMKSLLCKRSCDDCRPRQDIEACNDARHMFLLGAETLSRYHRDLIVFNPAFDPGFSAVPP